MCDMLHEHGALAACRALVRRAACAEHGVAARPRGPSQIPSDFEFLTYAMRGPTRTTSGTFSSSTSRRRSGRATAGFDIVYVYGAHSYLPQQFLTPYYNKRTDEYGGSFENRARFWRETIEMVKEAVGDDCAISVRFASTCFTGEAGDAARRRRRPAIHRARRPSRRPVGHQRLRHRRVGRGRDAVALPPARAAQLPWQAARQGMSQEAGPRRRPLHEPGHDGRGRSRAASSTSSAPRGRRSPTRSCRRRSTRAGSTTSASASAATSASRAGRSAGRRLICTQNATAGEEYRRGWHPERFTTAANADNDVLVVGAGPAGMECAMVLGKRGMRRVHLVEAQDDMGGTMRWIPQLPGLGEWARIVNYRKIQIDKLKNVEFIPNTRLAREGRRRVRRRDRRRRDRLVLGDRRAQRRHARPIPGADATLPQADAGSDHGRGQAVHGESVVVFDNDGYFMGVSLAEKLADGGKR